FSDCSSLLRIEVGAGNPFFSASDGVLFDKLQSRLLAYPSGKTGPYIIPDDVTEIDTLAFFACNRLSKVTLGKNLMYRGSFRRCRNLLAIEVDPLNPFFSSVDGVLFDKTQQALLDYPVGKAGAYTVPDSAASVAPFAFSTCIGLTSITIPTSV